MCGWAGGGVRVSVVGVRKGRDGGRVVELQAGTLTSLAHLTTPVPGTSVQDQVEQWARDIVAGVNSLVRAASNEPTIGGQVVHRDANPEDRSAWREVFGLDHRDGEMKLQLLGEAGWKPMADYRVVVAS